MLADTYWQERRNNHDDIASLLMANSVTGAASLFPRELLDHALPFPPGQFHHFHDHWLGLTALALGEIEFVERPLYDYVQHGDAVLGHAQANRMARLGERIRGWRRPLRDRVRLWRLTYFVDACRLLQFATILDLRCGDSDGARQAPRARALPARGSLAAAARRGWRARAAREFVGRPETLGAELGLLFGFTWRHAVGASVRAGEPPRRGAARHAAARAPRAQAGQPRPGAGDSLRVIHEKLSPLDFAPRDDAPERVNLLIPTIDLEHFFGGYIGKFNLPRQLAERGMRVRDRHGRPRRAAAAVLAADGRVIQRARRPVRQRRGGVRARVATGRGEPRRPVRRDHLVDGAPRAHTRWRAPTRERFLYLIQEYEPFTFAMGSLRRSPTSPTRFPHHALFSTELLRDWFRAARPRRVRDRRRSAGDAALGGVPERDHGRAPAAGRRARRAHDAQAAVLRAARGRTRRATCSSSARSR